MKGKDKVKKDDEDQERYCYIYSRRKEGENRWMKASGIRINLGMLLVLIRLKGIKINGDTVSS